MEADGERERCIAKLAPESKNRAYVDVSCAGSLEVWKPMGNGTPSERLGFGAVAGPRFVRVSSFFHCTIV